MGDAIEVLARAWRELSWVLDAVRGFPLYAVGMLFLGLWLFWRGRAVLVEPAHEIDLGLAGDGGRGSDRDSGRVPAGATGWGPRLGRLVGARRRRGDKIQASPLRAGDRPHEPGAAGYPRFPYHDAPLWLLGWSMVFAGSLALASADTLWSLASEVPHRLERVVLGVFVPDGFLPLPRPAVALAVYSIVAYLALEAARALVGGALGLSRLHLLHENDRRRRAARGVFALCGYRDFRWLDPGSARWWFWAAVGSGVGLVGADLAVFYGRATGWLGPLAVAHLFPAALSRFFDAVWLYPVRFRHRPHRRHSRLPVEHLAKELARRGWVVAEGEGGEAEPLAWRLHAREDGAEEPFEAGGAEVLSEFLRASTGGEAWFGHQKQAWDASSSGKSTLLVCPAESGKTAVASMLAVRVAVEDGETALLVYPDPASCQREYDRFCDVLFRTSLRWNLAAVDATRADARTLDWSRAAPTVVFCDADSVEDLLLGRAEGPEAFLGALGLLVLEDAERLTGAPASNLYFLLRRLRLARDRLASRPLRCLVTALPVAEELHSQLALLLGEPLALVEGDLSPTSDVRAFPVRPPADSVAGGRATRPGRKRSELESFVDELRAAGHDPICVGEDVARAWDRGEGTEREGDARLSAAPVSVARLGDASAFRTVLAIRNAGARNPEPFHAAFWIALPEPFTALLVDELEGHRERGVTAWEERHRLPVGGSFCFSAENPHLRRRHLAAALRQMPLGVAELSVLWGGPLGDDALAGLQEEGLEEVPGSGPGGIRYRLRRGGATSPVRTRVVCGEAVSVEDAVRTGERLLLQVDRDVAGTWLYPGRVLVCGGRRYRVPLAPLSGESAATLLVRPEEASVRTVKVRRCALRWLDERDRIRSQAGPAAFVLRRGEVVFEEEVLGDREWDEDSNQPVATHLYEKLGRPNPKGSVRTLAAEISFPGESLSPGGLRVLEGVFRSVIRASFGNDPSPPEAVEIGDPERDGGEPTLRLVESYPGGVGYVERLTPLVVLEWLRLGALLVERVGARAPEVLLDAAHCSGLECGYPASALSVLEFLRGEEATREPRPTPGSARGPERGAGEAGKAVDEVRQLLERVVPARSGEPVTGLQPPLGEEPAARADKQAASGRLAAAYRAVWEQTAVKVGPIEP